VGNTEGFKEHTSANKLILESLPLIYREEGSATRNAMEKFIEKNKIKVRKKIQLTSNEAVKQAIIAGIGYSIMPLIGIKNELKNKQLHIIPVNGLPLKSTWNIVWLKNKNLSPVAKSFVKKIESDKAKVIDKYSVTSIGK
jgi:DNA-binding transcriptional LysR family regulator